MFIQKDEATAARRRVPARIFTSDGTSPDTGATADAVIMGVNSATTISLTSTLRPMNPAQGMYWVELTQSETSVLGTHPLYHTAGDFPQHFATLEIVSVQPYSTVSIFDPSAHSVGLKAVVHSGATVEANNLVGDFSAATVRISGGTATGVTNKVDIRAGDYSDVSFRVSAGTVTGVVNKVDLRAGDYSDVSVRIGASGIYAASFQAGAIDGAALAAMNLSDVTVRVQPMLYSGMTVGINDAVGDMSSKFTVGVGIMAAGTYSGVTISGLQSMVSADVHNLRGTATPAIRLLSHLSSVVTGTAITGQLSTTTMTADVAEATDDHFNDRVIVFTSGALLGQATSITSYFGASNGSSRFVFPALTEAPANNDTFIIV